MEIKILPFNFIKICLFTKIYIKNIYVHKSKSKYNNVNNQFFSDSELKKWLVYQNFFIS